MESLLSNLNTEQAQAVQATEGNALILAGAGTGKTKVLTTKIAHILNQGLAYPSQILSVTFTNKAAKEMRERVANTLDFDINGLWLGTFHSISVRILRKHAELVGLLSDFDIIGEDEQLSVIKKILKEKNIDTKDHKPKSYLYQINAWKDKGLYPEDPKLIAFMTSGLPDVIDVYDLYQARIHSLNSCDFNDLLLYVINILKQNEDIRQYYVNKFRYVLVDEYQDTNKIQNLWLRYISGNIDGMSTNISCVGDDDQSIYGWRGADIGNILNFEKDFKNTSIIRLEQNYRSTQHILSVASAVIDNNKGRHGKKLWSDNGDGDKVVVSKYSDGRDEAVSIARKIKDIVRTKNIKADDVAVLIRAGYQTRLFEEVFLAESLPYKIVGALKFYDRREIKDCIAYLKLVLNPNNDLALERIINTPRRGLGEVTMSKISLINGGKSSLFNKIATAIDESIIKGKTKDKLLELITSINKWKTLELSLSLSELARVVLVESGYINMWKEDKSIDAETRIGNIEEFIKSLDNFTNLQEFLEYISLVNDNDDSSAIQDSVNIMTMHAAKGLEFDTVFSPSWEEGIFPNARVLDESGEEAEEERRLAYVAITRAKKSLYISYAGRRFEFGEFKTALPSRFIRELPKENIVNYRQTNSFARNEDIEDNLVLDKYQKTRTSFTNAKSQSFFEQFKPKVSSTLGGTGDAKGYRLGAKVMHKKFDVGTVIGVEGEKIKVSFARHGIKTILKKFLDLQ